MTKPFDSHCHVYREEYEEDRQEVIDRAKDELNGIIATGTTIETSKQAISLSDKNQDFVHATAGIHPGRPDSFDDINKLERLLAEQKVAAVGEIGLDYQVATTQKERKDQEEVFRKQIELAVEHNMPVVIHSRNAEKQAVKILEDSNHDKVFMHCFNGSSEILEKALDNDFMIGVTTQIMYSKRAKQVANNIPLSNLLLETDSPFLYPNGRNEPSKINELVREISDLRPEDAETIIEKTNSNLEQTFNISG